MAKPIIYNGSIQCACGRILTPLEAILDDMCPRCRAEEVLDGLKNRMNGSW